MPIHRHLLVFINLTSGGARIFRGGGGGGGGCVSEVKNVGSKTYIHKFINMKILKI